MKYILFTILIFLLCMAFLGCNKYNKDIATKQVSRAALTYEEIMTEYCAKAYRTGLKVDSTGWFESMKKIDSLRESLKKIEEAGPGEIYISPAYLDSLATELRKTMPIADPNCDSLSEPLYRMAAEASRRADQAIREAEFHRKANMALLSATKDLKPVVATQMDFSALKTCEIEKGKLLDIIAEANKRADRYKAGRNSWRKAALISGGLMLLWLLLKLRSAKK